MLALLDTYPTTRTLSKIRQQLKPAIKIEPFVDAIDQYAPPRIPIHADIFAPMEMTRYLNKFWVKLILQGVTVHPILQDHIDFYKSEHASELHVELERAMSAKD